MKLFGKAWPAILVGARLDAAQRLLDRTTIHGGGVENVNGGTARATTVIRA
jgi:hypothetical protein